MFARIATGLVLAPVVVLLLVFLPETAGAGMVALAGLLAMDEYDRIVRPGRGRDAVWFVEMGALALLFLVALRPFASVFLPGVIFLSLAALAVIRLSRPVRLEEAVNDIARPLLGVIWIGLPLALLSTILSGGLTAHGGGLVALAILAMVFSGDSCAYFAGRSLGRHKLYPAISPKKTVEGGVGGLLGSVGGGLLVKAIFGLPMDWLPLALIGVLAGAAEQLGDFCESMLKRGAGVKDSGTLLPGHGGMFDRIDGVLFAAPVVYYSWLLVNAVW
ncbi:MAG: phosphatidate cytidylyltransferase [Pseudomonadota bacterium]